MIGRQPMTNADIAWLLAWRPSSGHPGGWRVTRQDYRPGADPHLQEQETRNGRIRLWRTFEGAKRYADKLNLEQR